MTAKSKLYFKLVLQVVLFVLAIWFIPSKRNRQQREPTLYGLNPRFNPPLSPFEIYLKNLFAKSQNNRQEEGCHHPQLELWSAEILKHIRNVSKITCETEDPDWLLVRNGFVKIDQQVIAKYNEIDCEITYMKRLNDKNTTEGDLVELNSSTNRSVKLVDDFFWAKCTTLVNETEVKAWENVMAGVHRDESVMKRASEKTLDNKDKLNVLMFGFDSTSRLQFIRKLPNTYDHLTKKLDAIVLEGYNIVGDGTPQALVPILTGKTEYELPETRKRHYFSNFVDVYPFIWNNFSDNGYVTGYTEDNQWVGTFSFRMKGFDKQPTDHFMRPFYLEAEKLYKNHSDLCLQATPRHQIMLNWVKDMFTVYPKEIPKFVFGFHSEFSHGDFNLIQAIDDDFVDWINSLEDQGILNSTILIVMADHGSRFSETRNTHQGKLEERLPFFSFVLPKWFKTVYPNAYQNLVDNKNRLTTPFDIHATFLTIIEQFNKKQDVSDYSYDKLPRSLSLFSKIPETRTCLQAGIQPHWCTCLKWILVNTSDELALKAANALVDYLNNMTSEFRANCSVLKLKNLTRAEVLLPNKNLLTFVRSRDSDGLIPDLGGRIQISEMTFQIQLQTSPNDGLYEATILHSLQNGNYLIKESDISRINKYGDQPKCIQNEQPQLRKYCYCVV